MPWYYYYAVHIILFLFHYYYIFSFIFIIFIIFSFIFTPILWWYAPPIFFFSATFLMMPKILFFQSRWYFSHITRLFPPPFSIVLFFLFMLKRKAQKSAKESRYARWYERGARLCFLLFLIRWYERWCARAVLRQRYYYYYMPWYYLYIVIFIYAKDIIIIIVLRKICVFAFLFKKKDIIHMMRPPLSPLCFFFLIIIFLFAMRAPLPFFSSLCVAATIYFLFPVAGACFLHASSSFRPPAAVFSAGSNIFRRHTPRRLSRRLFAAFSQFSATLAAVQRWYRERFFFLLLVRFLPACPSGEPRICPGEKRSLLRLPGAATAGL